MRKTLQKARFVVVLPGGIVEEFLCLGVVVSSLFGVFMVVPPFALMLGLVVVFLLVAMPQSSPLYWGYCISFSPVFQN